MDITRTCCRCGEEKEIGKFYRAKDGRDGYCGHCKVCQNRASRLWAEKNPERAREINRRSGRKQAGVRNARQKANYWNNPEKHRMAVREDYQKLKRMAYDAYGGSRCACCGESEPKFLCLDHVNGNGNEHRKVVKAEYLYRWLRDNNYPPEFQVLCFNCNQGKRLNGNVCPHKALYGIDIVETGR